MDDKGFQKIDLNSQEDAIEPQAMESKSRTKRRWNPFSRIRNKKVRRGVMVGVVIFALFFLFTGYKTYAVVRQSQIVMAQAKVSYDAIKNQNIALAKDELQKTKVETEKLNSDMDSIGYIKFVPLAGWYFSDVDHMVNASIHGIDAGLIAVDALLPYADVLGLEGSSSFTGGSAQDRIRLAVKTMGKVVPEIDKIEGKLILAQKEIDKVDPKRYPNIGKIKQVRSALEQIKSVADGSVVAVEQGKPLIKALPDLLGETEEKKYLVLFQNDAELRPTGGFLTYYAIFRIQEGVINVDSSSDIYELDDSIARHPAADPIIIKYLPKVSQMFIRDINLSPDFIESMNDFNELYATSSRETDVDGIIAIDTDFLVNIIRILGEVQASGLTFNAEEDERCDCPQVVYVLEDEISRPVNFVKTDRKGLLADLMLATMDKALSSSPKEYWGRLFQQFVEDAQEKHVLMFMYNEDAQKGIDALGWSGRIKNFEGDYIHVNDANFGGQKSNLFVTKSMKVDYSIASDGKIDKKVAIEYKNPREHSDCNLERGGLCLNATLRNFQRVYVPEGSVLKTSKGSEVKVETKEDLGKTVFESFFTVKPLGRAEITYEYTLPFKLEKGSALPVLIQKQPGVSNIPMEITVNGKKVEDFDLLTDKILNLEV